ncbi:uncharacterized protein BJX67DRAFT_330145 [Aspergillus lucknowensis]|uniref:Mucin n=1 Tax=Aspergillus lucknowensis TaxID=176173 RepID=A0ABR4LXZ1_9EURO
MESALYDSFRWLDEDTDLDLSLDNYQQQEANSSSRLPQKQKPSFRRPFSSNSVNLSRKSVSPPSYRKDSTSNPLPAEPQSALANIVSRRSSLSRPLSKSKPRHVSRSSTSSIDPSAQYFHDPEARLKLRVFLASPQKFDEAIELGFPALKNDEPIIPESFRPESIPQIREFTGTFLDDDDHDHMSVRGEEKEPYSNISRLSYVMETPHDDFQDSPTVDDKEPSSMTRSKWKPPRNPNTREMTLRMTLTRPDLRAASCIKPASMTDPANEPHLSSSDWGSEFQEQDADDQSLMKKMWRKFRRRRY